MNVCGGDTRVGAVHDHDRGLMTMTNLDRLHVVAEEAATIGAQLLSERRIGRVTAKEDRDYASELDVAIERAVREHLALATPEVGFLGEEEGASGEAEALTWVLDPVDGTANLLHQLPLCGVSLGLLDRGRPVIGVIDLPFLGERFTAREGGGARLNGQPIMVRQADGLRDAIISIGDFATGPDAAIGNERRLAIMGRLAATVERVRMLGSAAIDLAWVAAGRLDASILLSNKPWDVSAGVIIAREAGAVVVDAAGSPHTLGSAATIAGSPALMPSLIDSIG
jgi:myo-inositol-1(or 4)-monophosphatase